MFIEIIYTGLVLYNTQKEMDLSHMNCIVKLQK